MSLLRHIWPLLRLHTRLHPCIHDASGQHDAAEKIAANRFCNSWTVAAVWIQDRGGRVSETKGNALA